VSTQVEGEAAGVVVGEAPGEADGPAPQALAVGAALAVEAVERLGPDGGVEVQERRPHPHRVERDVAGGHLAHRQPGLGVLVRLNLVA
jgi:hypothetical protein